MIEIKRIDESIMNDINIPNEPFTLWGKMVPTYDGNKWAYKTEKFEESKVGEMVFPEENRIMYTNQEVSSAAVILVRTMGWVN